MISVFLFVVLLLVACSWKEKGELTRVDVFIENQNDIHIQDEDTLTLLEKAFEQIKWDNKVVDMARGSDVEATFFYTFDENMPERLVEYEIWFNENGTATIVSNAENKSYGKLDKGNTENLKIYF
jgi:hypothetical protein